MERMKTEYWETEEKMVFIKRMKTTIQEGRGKSGVHQANEHQQSKKVEEKMVFIKQMKATIQEDRRKRGVHQANENHNPRRPRKKWCSSSR
jgi:hypothetical protein